MRAARPRAHDRSMTTMTLLATDDDGDRLPGPMLRSCEVRDLRRRYGTTEVLRGVSFDVQPR